MAVLPTPEPSAAAPPLGLAALRQRLADYAELTKPRIAVMALVTVAAGYLVGAAGDFRWAQLGHTLLGAGLVAAGGSSLNHWLERGADARMRRTANRPLPSGRVRPIEALAFGVLLAAAGVGHLLYWVPHPGAALAAGATFLMYVAVYTPLKRVTTWNTVVGAVPGALPPVIGWLAARDALSGEAWALFGILFVWQLPHFYSIAWLHREDYARGGMKMLPVVEGPDGRRTGWATLGTCTLLVAVTATPFLVGMADWVYLAGAMPLSAWFWLRCLRFARNPDRPTAKGVLRGSLVYLVGVMALLVIDAVAPR